jgi:hypothetical protein
MTNRSFEHVLRDWLDSGSDRTPSTAIDAVLLAVKTTPQERDLRIPRRFTHMAYPMRLAAAIAIVAVVGVGALTYFTFGPASSFGGKPTPLPTLPPEPSATAARPASPNLLDTAGWTSYRSNRYGFTIKHPANWTERPSDHVWTLAVDASSLNKATEGFIAPGTEILVTAWSSPVAAGTTTDSWLQTYCPKVTTPCTGLSELSRRTSGITVDGHTGILVRFSDDTQAFVIVDNRMYIVAVWEPDNDPRTEPYGGSIRLLMAYLSTMHFIPGGPASPAPTAVPA